MKWIVSGGNVFLGSHAQTKVCSIWGTGDRIEAVKTTDPDVEAEAVRAGAQLIDASGQTVLPGLIDAHAHVGLLDLFDQSRFSAAEQAALIFRNLESSLRQGFTTLRDLGGVDGGLTRAIDRGLVPGPRVFPSGSFLSQTGGHGDYRHRYSVYAARVNPDLGSGPLVQSGVICDGVPEVTAATREQLRRGARQIKVFVSGGQLSDGDPLDSPQFSSEELSAIVNVARDRDVYVTVHAHTVRGVHRALRAGVRCIEHATVMDENTVTMIKNSGAFVVPTLAISEVMRRFPQEWDLTDEMLADGVALDKAETRSITMLHEAGVPLGSGSDLVGTRQDQRGWEIALKARIIGAEQAVLSATKVNAEIMGISHELGSIAPGYIADLAIFDAPVLESPELFMTTLPSTVLKAGEIVVQNGVLHRNVA